MEQDGQKQQAAEAIFRIGAELHRAIEEAEKLGLHAAFVRNKGWDKEYVSVWEQQEATLSGIKGWEVTNYYTTDQEGSEYVGRHNFPGQIVTSSEYNPGGIIGTID